MLRGGKVMAETTEITPVINSRRTIQYSIALTRIREGASRQASPFLDNLCCMTSSVYASTWPNRPSAAGPAWLARE